MVSSSNSPLGIRSRGSTARIVVVPLEADTTYVVVVPAGGIADVTGNATSADKRFVFTTGGELAPLEW